jgi:hypothetical protein
VSSGWAVVMGAYQNPSAESKDHGRRLGETLPQFQRSVLVSVHLKIPVGMVFHTGHSPVNTTCGGF